MVTLKDLQKEFGYAILDDEEISSIRENTINWASVEGELIIRKCLKSFPAYLQASNFGYSMTAYHYSLASNLQRDYERGPNKGMSYGLILLSAPPQTGKSLTVTESFQSWVLIKEPRTSVITVGYEANFAKRFGRRNRDKFMEFAPILSHGRLKLHDNIQATDSWESMKLDPHSNKWVSSNGGMYTAGIGGAITGKWLPNETPIWTPKGWVKHGDLKVGDEVFGMDGKPKKVIRLLPKHQQRIYELVLDNGAVVMECAGQHEWQVNYQRQSNTGRLEIRTYNIETRHIFDPKIPVYTKKGEYAGYDLSKDRLLSRTPFIQTCGVTQESNKDLPIDPYCLGLWLGDGISKSTDVCGLKEDLEIYKQYTPYPQQDLRFEKNNVYLLQVCERKQLDDLNLFRDKHIPSIYLHSSIEQRYSLLQGIIDTDGYIFKRDGQVDISSANPQLSRDIQLLVRSLGYKVHLIKSQSGADRIRFWANGDEVLSRLPRKQKNVRRSTSRTKRHFIKEVRVTDKFKMGNCITVEGDGMYLAGEHLIPTHNTGNVVIIDDPIKNMQDAESETQIENNIDYFTTVIETRLHGNPGSLCVVMCTRWVVNDMIGWCRKNRKKYIVGDYNYASLCTDANRLNDPLKRFPGEGICPEMNKGSEWAESIKESYTATQGGHVYNAMFQGEPSNELGNLFKAENWGEYEISKLNLDECDRVYLSIDATFKDNKTSDFVAMKIGAAKGNLDYLRYLVRKRMDLPDTLDKILKMLKMFPEIDIILIEDKANGSGIISVLRKWRKKLNIDIADFPSVVEIEPQGGKYARAQAAAPFQREGRCMIPCEKDAHLLSSEDDFEWDEKGLSYTHCFKQELGTFPYGQNDDMVDAHTQSIIYNMALLTGDEIVEKKIVRFTRYSRWWDCMWEDYNRLKTREEKNAFIKRHGAPIEWKPKNEGEEFYG